MELNFRPVGKTSALNERPFQPGDTAVSYLYRGESDGLVERLDLHLEDEEKARPVGPVICRWTHRIREQATTDSELRKQQIQSTEELFIALCDAHQSGEALDERQALLALIALQLERKRVIRPQGGNRYLHVRSKTVYTVPQVDLTPESLLSIQDQLGHLLLSPREN